MLLFMLQDLLFHPNKSYKKLKKMPLGQAYITKECACLSILKAPWLLFLTDFCTAD